MAIMTHAKFHFNWLMLTSIFGIWASEPPGPGERLKRPGLIGLSIKSDFLSWQKSLAYSLRIFVGKLSLLSPLQRVLAAWFKIFN